VLLGTIVWWPPPPLDGVAATALGALQRRSRLTTGKIVAVMVFGLCRVPNGPKHGKALLCRVAPSKHTAKIRNTAKFRENTQQRNKHGNEQ
jgi:hypothetical protein